MFAGVLQIGVVRHVELHFVAAATNEFLQQCAEMIYAICTIEEIRREAKIDDGAVLLCVVGLADGFDESGRPFAVIACVGGGGVREGGVGETSVRRGADHAAGWNVADVRGHAAEELATVQRLVRTPHFAETADEIDRDGIGVIIVVAVLWRGVDEHLTEGFMAFEIGLQSGHNFFLLDAFLFEDKLLENRQAVGNRTDAHHADTVEAAVDGTAVVEIEGAGDAVLRERGEHGIGQTVGRIAGEIGVVVIDVGLNAFRDFGQQIVVKVFIRFIGVQPFEDGFEAELRVKTSVAPGLLTAGDERLDAADHAVIPCVFGLYADLFQHGNGHFVIENGWEANARGDKFRAGLVEFVRRAVMETRGEIGGGGFDETCGFQCEIAQFVRGVFAVRRDARNGDIRCVMNAFDLCPDVAEHIQRVIACQRAVGDVMAVEINEILIDSTERVMVAALALEDDEEKPDELQRVKERFRSRACDAR